MFTYTRSCHVCRICYYASTTAGWFLLSSLHLLLLDSTDSAIFYNLSRLIDGRYGASIFNNLLRYRSTCIWIETLMNVLASVKLLLMLWIDRATILTSVSITSNKTTRVSKTLVNLVSVIARWSLTLFNWWTHVRTETIPLTWNWSASSCTRSMLTLCLSD